MHPDVVAAPLPELPLRPPAHRVHPRGGHVVADPGGRPGCSWWSCPRSSCWSWSARRGPSVCSRSHRRRRRPTSSPYRRGSTASPVGRSPTARSTRCTAGSSASGGSRRSRGCRPSTPSAGPLQQLLGLADVTVTTASARGAVRIRGLAADDAAELARVLTATTHATPAGRGHVHRRLPGRRQAWRRLDPRMLVVGPLKNLCSSCPSSSSCCSPAVPGTSTRSGIAIGGAAVVVLAGVLRWRTTCYRITDERVELHSGWLRRQRRSVPRDRIRTVDLTAPRCIACSGCASCRSGRRRAGRRPGPRARMDSTPSARPRPNACDGSCSTAHVRRRLAGAATGGGARPPGLGVAAVRPAHVLVAGRGGCRRRSRVQPPHRGGSGTARHGSRATRLGGWRPPRSGPGSGWSRRRCSSSRGSGRCCCSPSAGPATGSPGSLTARCGCGTACSPAFAVGVRASGCGASR